MVTFVMSPTSVQEGDDVILSCYAEGKGLFDILRVYRILENVEKDVISDNDVLKNAYVEMGRHEILAFSPDRMLSFIKIKITSEYSGHAGSIPNGDQCRSIKINFQELIPM